MTISRRFFLRGLGATVALPVLPSLLAPREARAQAATPTPCFASFATNHGGVWASNMFPAPPATGVETQTYAGRTIRRFPLAATRADGVAQVSPVLAAADGLLTPRLLGKMFTIQGVGVPWYLAHNTGGALGNYAQNAGNGGDATAAQTLALRPTIDQIMGWSSAFYPDLAAVRQRVMVTSDRASYDHSSPATRTGDVQEITGIARPNDLFDALFPQADGPPGRRPIVDRVLESYQRLRTSTRLSRADKLRLDAHLERLAEVERRLRLVVNCGAVGRPSNPSMGLTLGDLMWTELARDPGAHALYHQAFNDLFVLAFSCGVSRVAVSRVDLTFSDFAGDWHQAVAHLSQDAGPQQTLLEAHRRVFASVIVDLASKLDAVETASGGTLLDQTLLAWVQESGNHTHDSATVPVVGFGGAAGFLRTGHHHDYRNLALPLATDEAERRYPGLVWNQWLGTVLQAMRVPRAEWERPQVNGGYPDYRFVGADDTSQRAWPQAVWDVSGSVLPWLAAA